MVSLYAVCFRVTSGCPRTAMVWWIHTAHMFPVFATLLGLLTHPQLSLPSYPCVSPARLLWAVLLSMNRESETWTWQTTLGLNEARVTSSGHEPLRWLCHGPINKRSGPKEPETCPCVLGRTFRTWGTQVSWPHLRAIFAAHHMDNTVSAWVCDPGLLPAPSSAYSPLSPFYH